MPVLNAIDSLLDRLTENIPDKNETQKVRDRLERQTNYFWKRQDEKTVKGLFQKYHEDITTALIPGNELKLPSALKEVLDWGGIHNNAPMCGKIDENGGVISLGRYAEYLLLLRELETVADATNDQPAADVPKRQITNTVAIKIMEEIKDDLYPVYCHTASNDLTPLASWTKILAAYKPEEFWIYDSRVAIALRFLNQFLEKKYAQQKRGDWYTPVPKKDDDDGDTSYLQEKIGKGVYTDDSREKQAKRCYQDYCDLLRKTGRIEHDRNAAGADAANLKSSDEISSSCEKKLFMLGGLLNDLYELTVIQNKGFRQYQKDNIETVRQKYGRILKIFEDLDDDALEKMSLPEIKDRIRAAIRRPSTRALLNNFRRLMADVRAESFRKLRENGYKQRQIVKYLISLLGVQDKQALRDTLGRLRGEAPIKAPEGGSREDILNSQELDFLRKSLRRKRVAIDYNVN